MQPTSSSRPKAGILFASGAALMLVFLLLLQSLLGGALPGTKTVTVTVTTSATDQEVADAYANHLALLSIPRTQSVPARGYESNATVEWTGAIAGLTGNYSGSANISILLGSFFGKFVNFSLSSENQSIRVRAGTFVVNSTLVLQAYSSILGKVNGTIAAQDVYEHIGSSWLISRETWNFTQFNQQFPMT